MASSTSVVAQAMKRARLESQGRASSSHAPTVALSSGDRPGSGVEPPGATSDLTDTSESQSAGLRAFVCDLWKHKKLSDKDICSLCHWITIAGVN